MVAKRCEGFGDSPRSSASCSGFGICVPAGRGSTLPEMVLKASASMVLPAKGSLPYSASYSATQKLN